MSTIDKRPISFCPDTPVNSLTSCEVEVTVWLHTVAHDAVVRTHHEHAMGTRRQLVRKRLLLLAALFSKFKELDCLLWRLHFDFVQVLAEDALSKRVSNDFQRLLSCHNASVCTR